MTRRLSPLSAPPVVPLLAALALAFLGGCSNDKPAESPETTASSSEAATKAPPSAGGDPESTPSSTNGTSGSPSNAGATAPPKGTAVPSGMSMDAYELTPSDCNALGHHYSEVAKADQVVLLSPKLSDAKRAATIEQIDRVVGKLEDTWTNNCQRTLVNQAVDHDNITCALKSASVHAFDVCLNGKEGTPQAGAGKGKKP